MSNMKPIGKWIVAKALIGGEKTTAAGIIFQEKSKSRIIPAKVLALPSKLEAIPARNMPVT